MRTFVKYRSTGEIVSVTTVETMPAHLDQPFHDFAEGESVLEVHDLKAVRGSTAVELHSSYRVDVAKAKLVKIRKTG